MAPRIFWIGDSTVQFNNISTWPQCGMGQVLDLYVRPGIAVYDHARNGRSTKSFYDEGLWAPVEAALCPGDLLLMQFGHNDEKSEDPTRYAAPDQFAANLLAYAHAAQAKGALPVLITPLVRRRFEGGILVPTHGAYPDAVRLLAAREDLPLIDLSAASTKLVQEMGEPSSRELYMVFTPNLYPNYPDGKEDNTHLRYLGAVRFAGLVAAGLHQSPVPYADVVTTTTHKTLRGPRGGVILTNNEELAKKFNKAIFPGTQGGPLEHVIAAKAVCFGEALKPEFKAYQQRVVDNAKALAAALQNQGFNLVSGGTDNHLMLIDLRGTGVTGKELQRRLDEVYITANKNAIPNDPESPFVTSGQRIGTPAVTTRGFGKPEMLHIAEFIWQAATDFDNKADEIRRNVCEICSRFPIY